MYKERKKKEYYCKYVISAVGEFSFPKNGDIIGSENAIHSSQILDYEGYTSEKDTVAIIGGYESGIDAAWGLYKKWIPVHIFCPHKIDETSTSDPSQILSLYSNQRFREIQEHGNIHLTQQFITQIKKEERCYTLVWKDGYEYNFMQRPILATGFDSGLGFLWDYVGYRADNMPELNAFDELKKTQGIFIVGPQVRQDNLIFCFIYKFRLRFWIVALEIAKRLWKKIDYEWVQKTWEKQWFFLDDVWSCGDECAC